MVFFAISVNAAINAVALLPQVMSPAWRYTAPYLITATVYFLFAGILWRGAERFGSVRAPEDARPPVDAESALRIAMLAVAFYVALTHLPATVNCVLAATDPKSP